jgi:hypothetical protein
MLISHSGVRQGNPLEALAVPNWCGRFRTPIHLGGALRAFSPDVDLESATASH